MCSFWCTRRPSRSQIRVPLRQGLSQKLFDDLGYILQTVVGDQCHRSHSGSHKVSPRPWSFSPKRPSLAQTNRFNRSYPLTSGYTSIFQTCLALRARSCPDTRLSGDWVRTKPSYGLAKLHRLCISSTAGRWSRRECPIIQSNRSCVAVQVASRDGESPSSDVTVFV